MIVAESKVRKLFKEMGRPWKPQDVSLEVLNHRLVNIRAVLSKADAPATDASTELLKNCLAAIDCGDSPEVVPDDDVAEATRAELAAKAHEAGECPPKAPGVPQDERKPKGKGKVASKPESVPAASQAPSNGSTPEKRRGVRSTPPSGRHPGIGKAIIDILTKATPGRPVTKMEILEELCRRFPDREKTGMYLTVQSLVPRTINKRGAYVVGHDEKKKHFWLISGPHPEAHTAEEARRVEKAPRKPQGRPRKKKGEEE